METFLVCGHFLAWKQRAASLWTHANTGSYERERTREREKKETPTSVGPQRTRLGAPTTRHAQLWRLTRREEKNKVFGGGVQLGLTTVLLSTGAAQAHCSAPGLQPRLDWHCSRTFSRGRRGTLRGWWCACRQCGCPSSCRPGRARRRSAFLNSRCRRWWRRRGAEHIDVVVDRVLCATDRNARTSAPHDQPCHARDRHRSRGTASDPISHPTHPEESRERITDFSSPNFQRTQQILQTLSCTPLSMCLLVISRTANFPLTSYNGSEVHRSKSLSVATFSISLHFTRVPHRLLRIIDATKR